MHLCEDEVRSLYLVFFLENHVNNLGQLDLWEALSRGRHHEFGSPESTEECLKMWHELYGCWIWHRDTGPVLPFRKILDGESGSWGPRNNFPRLPASCRKRAIVRRFWISGMLGKVCRWMVSVIGSRGKGRKGINTASHLRSERFLHEGDKILIIS